MQNALPSLLIQPKTFVKELNLGKPFHFSLFLHKFAEFEERIFRT